MIQSSFCCFKGFSKAAEQKIWQLGCYTWDRISMLPEKTFSKRKMVQLSREIRQARKALEGGLADYFLNRFDHAEKIRILNDFKNQAAFIDIETTGLTLKDTITTIAVLANKKIHIFVNGFDLDVFLTSLKGVEFIITFNGTRFDLPFLRRHFSIDLNVAHLDMMPVLSRMGYKGGQKKCEEKLGLIRTMSHSIDGEDAIQLWNSWSDAGNRNALKQLVFYNAEDVFMLEKLSVRAFNLAAKSMPFSFNLYSDFHNTLINPNFVFCSVL